jgi:cytochrome c-type biogenesis protein CcmH/NrfG
MDTTTRRAQIEQMLQEEPNDAELGYMLAMEYASGGDDVGAVRCFQQLLQRNPDYAPGYHQGARSLIRLNRIEEAKAMLRGGIPAATRKNDQHAVGEMQELLASLD